MATVVNDRDVQLLATSPRMLSVSNAGKIIFTGYFPGSASNVNSSLRLYPGVNGTITTVQVWASAAVSVDTNVTISVGTAAGGSTPLTVTIPAGSSSGSTTFNFAIIDTNFLTAALVGNNALNVGFRGEITTS